MKNKIQSKNILYFYNFYENYERIFGNMMNKTQGTEEERNKN